MLAKFFLILFLVIFIVCGLFMLVTYNAEPTPELIYTQDIIKKVGLIMLILIYIIKDYV